MANVVGVVNEVVSCRRVDGPEAFALPSVSIRFWGMRSSWRSGRPPCFRLPLLVVGENVRGFRFSPLMECGWTVLCNVADGRTRKGVVFRGP